MSNIGFESRITTIVGTSRFFKSTYSRDDPVKCLIPDIAPISGYISWQQRHLLTQFGWTNA
jgi:hypothetical protein